MCCVTQAAGVMTLITEAKWKREGQAVDTAALDRMRADIAGRIDRESGALYSTARLWDDGIIDPRDTRRVLSLALSASLNAPIEQTSFGIFRM